MAKSIIEGAYLVGFEPSSDNLSDEALYAEAVEFLNNSIRFNNHLKITVLWHRQPNYSKV